MSSSTALLPKNRKDEFPIFLRVCHSPWVSIGQSALVVCRAILAFYMTAVFVALVYHKERHAINPWAAPFEFSVIIYLLQFIYAWITFVWAFMHLHYPHHGCDGFKKLLSPPRQCASSKNRVFFSIFYTAAVTYPHVITFAYWLIMVPHQHNEVDDVFGHGWFQTFLTINIFGVNSLIALIEVLFLSSIRRQEPIWAHVIGLTTLCLIYVGWVYIGKLCTGVFAHYVFDYNQIGWEHVIFAIASFCALSNILFAVVYGIIGVREMLTKNNDGYTRLPQ